MGGVNTAKTENRLSVQGLSLATMESGTNSTTAPTAARRWMVMGMREKLIEVLKGNATCLAMGIDSCESCPHGHDEDCYTSALVDHLIANGVTIPVRCHECKHWKNEINGCTEDKRFCDIGFYMVHKDGFCSFGERS